MQNTEIAFRVFNAATGRTVDGARCQTMHAATTTFKSMQALWPEEKGFVINSRFVN